VFKDALICPFLIGSIAPGAATAVVRAGWLAPRTWPKSLGAPAPPATPQPALGVAQFGCRVTPALIPNYANDNPSSHVDTGGETQ
jgi:hypothetical protein